MSQAINKSFKVRHMRINDVENVLNLEKTLNWPIGKYENQVMMKVDAEGFFIAEDDETGNKK